MGGDLLFVTNDSTPPFNWFRTFLRDFGRLSDDRLEGLRARTLARLTEAEALRCWPRPETAILHLAAILEDAESEMVDRAIGAAAAEGVAA